MTSPGFSLGPGGYTRVLGHSLRELRSGFSFETLDIPRLMVDPGIWHGCCQNEGPKVGPAREAGGMAYTGARPRFPAGPLTLRSFIFWSHPSHVVGRPDPVRGAQIAWLIAAPLRLAEPLRLGLNYLP